MIPCAIFRPPLQSKNAAIPSIDVYMVKVDGRKAVDAWNMPGLNKRTITNSSPMRGLTVRQMEEYNRTWQAEHKKASNNRMM
jgi:hypothetical protein